MRVERVFLAVLACSQEQSPIYATDPPVGGGVGDACDDATPCRTGLVCEDGACIAAGSTAACGGCTLSDECMDGFGCTPNTGSCPTGCEDCKPLSYGYCVPRGDLVEGDLCAADLECGDDLYCALVGLGGVCASSGNTDLGDGCASTADCLEGLWCSVPTSEDSTRTCEPPLTSFEPFEGVDCAKDEGEFRIYFEVGTQDDFYRLPFPNDALVSEEGQIDLSQHPTPGAGILGTDILREYFSRIEEEFSGFSPLSTIYFRFSGNLDFSALGDGDADIHYLIDVTEDADEFGRATNSFDWIASGTVGKYICDNWMGMVPRRPLLAGHTYAALLTRDVLSAEGDSAAQDADFAAMLGDTEPEDSRLVRAWEAYAPLRTYLAGKPAVAADDIAGGAVFTVANPTELVARVGTAVRAWEEASAVADVRICTGAAESADTPCACAEGSDAAITEIHGLVKLPVMQQGERPYLTNADGGDLELDNTGAPVVQDSEEVCFALSVPTGVASPLPVAIYGHGTGGDFMSGVQDIGATLADRGLATFGFTGVLHGERKGETSLTPDLLFFNVLNPNAARGNVLQGAADVFQAVRTLAEVSIDVEGGPVTFDPARIYYFGHSQGSTTGGLAVPFEPGIAAVVLSGAGGSLVETLTSKTSPINVAAVVDFVLQESADKYHPALNLLQTYFDPVDLVQFGPSFFVTPPDGNPPRHVLMTYGLGDTYTPPSTLGAFARALRVAPVGEVLEDYFGPSAISAPATANYTGSDPDVTAVLLQVDPMGEYDGHFVAFEDATLRGQWAAFLESAATAGVPTVP